MGSVFKISWEKYQEDLEMLVKVVEGWEKFSLITGIVS